MDRKQTIERLKEIAAGMRKPNEIDADNSPVIRIWKPVSNNMYQDINGSGLIVPKGVWDNDKGSRRNPRLNVVIVYPDDYELPPLASNEQEIDLNLDENFLNN